MNVGLGPLFPARRSGKGRGQRPGKSGVSVALLVVQCCQKLTERERMWVHMTGFVCDCVA